MKVLNKPQLTNLAMGETFKILKVEGLGATVMPPHYCTKEAIIVVLEGRAVLKMPESEHALKMGSSFVIPAGKEHTLSIQEDIKAIAIMAIDSEINFI